MQLTEIISGRFIIRINKLEAKYYGVIIIAMIILAMKIPKNHPSRYITREVVKFRISFAMEIMICYAKDKKCEATVAYFT